MTVWIIYRIRGVDDGAVLDVHGVYADRRDAIWEFNKLVGEHKDMTSYTLDSYEVQ